MIYKVSNNNIITLNRGDTLTLEIDLADYSEAALDENDNVYLGFMEPNQRWEDALMKRIGIPSNGTSVLFNFASSDTENILPGKYYYEIKLVRRANANNPGDIAEVKTLQSKKIFYII